MAVEKRERNEEHKTWEGACRGENVRQEMPSSCFVTTLPAVQPSVSASSLATSRRPRAEQSIIHSMYQSKSNYSLNVSKLSPSAVLAKSF